MSDPDRFVWGKKQVIALAVIGLVFGLTIGIGAGFIGLQDYMKKYTGECIDSYNDCVEIINDLPSNCFIAAPSPLNFTFPGDP